MAVVTALKRKISLLIVIDSLGCGGAEKSLINLLSMIDYTMVDVDLMLFARGGINEKYTPKNVNILNIGLINSKMCISSKIGYFIKRLSYSLSIRLLRPKDGNDICRRYYNSFKTYLNKLPKNYDVAFAYAQRLPTLFVSSNVNAKKKYCWTNVTINHNKSVHDFYLPFFSKYNGIICVSDDVKKTVDKNYPELKKQTQVIYDINNPEFIISLSNEKINYDFTNKFKILTVARLNFEQKGYDILIKAAKILSDKGIDYIWYILGEGPKQKEIEKFITLHHLENRLLLCGVRSNPYPFFKQAQLYVQTSRYEGYGLAIAEARLLTILR